MKEEPIFKASPQSIESEQAVIGGLLLSNDSFDYVTSIINTHDFYTQTHKDIFSTIVDLQQQKKPFDLVSVIEALENNGKIKELEDKNYIVEIVQHSSGSSNLEYYSRIIRDKSILRSLIKSSNEISETCYFPQGKEVREILDIAESKIMAIAEHGAAKQRSYSTMSDLLEGALNKIDELFNSDGNITGLETHLTEFDKITSGLQEGDLIIVAGRPSMGKTAFSMNIVENIAIQNKTPVAVFSLEMSGEQLAMRMLSSIGRINAQHMRTGKLNTDDWPKLNRAIGLLSEADVYIDDTPALMISELRARTRRIDIDVREKQRKKYIAEGVDNPEEMVTGLGLIVIDYLQLMQGSSSNVDNRVNEISEISRGLKSLSKELNVPVIALSQLNRSLEQRPDKRPKMSDLRESGAIEQDADLIVFIYRDEVYNPDSEAKGTAEIIIGKHRNGPLANMRFTFIGEYTRFENFAGYKETNDTY